MKQMKQESTYVLQHSKKVIKVPKKVKAGEILHYERKHLKVIVEMITGHCNLPKHLHTLGIVSEPDCRKWGMEEETAHHIVCECPAIKSIRVRLYGKPLLLPEEVMEEPLLKIAQFALETGLLK